MPRMPAMRVAGRSVSDTIVRTRMTLLVRCAVWVMKTSNAPTTASAVDGLHRRLEAICEDLELPRRRAARDDVEARMRQGRKDLTVRCKPAAQPADVTPQLDEARDDRVVAAVAQDALLEVVDRGVQVVQMVEVSADHPLEEAGQEARRVEPAQGRIAAEVIGELREGGDVPFMDGHQPVVTHGADERLGFRSGRARRKGEHAKHERLTEVMDERPVRRSHRRGPQIDWEQLAEPRESLRLGRVDVHPQQVAVGEPIQKRPVESNLMVVTVGNVEESAEASSDVGGVRFVAGNAFRGRVRVCVVSARLPCVLPCSLRHDRPHPGPGAFSTKAAPHEHVRSPDCGPCPPAVNAGHAVRFCGARRNAAAAKVCVARRRPRHGQAICSSRTLRDQHRHRQADPRPLGDESTEGSQANERAAAAGVRLSQSAVNAGCSAPQRDDDAGR